MSKFEVSPGRGRRAFAFVAVTAIAVLFILHRASSRVAAAALHLYARGLAFLPSLPLNLTMREI
jgi:hypothetical protein